MATANPVYNPAALAGGGTSITETSGPTVLTIGAVADTAILRRDGTGVVGTTGLVYVESQARFGIGASGGGIDYSFHLKQTQASGLTLGVQNTHASGGASYARAYILADDPASGDSYTHYEIRGTTSWTVGIDNSDSDTFKIGPNAAVGTSTCFTATVGRSVACGLGALATNATVGHFYIPTSAGAPTGVPEGISGFNAIQYDTTNNKIYVYNGAWRSTAALT